MKRSLLLYIRFLTLSDHTKAEKIYPIPETCWCSYSWGKFTPQVIANYRLHKTINIQILQGVPQILFGLIPRSEHFGYIIWGARFPSYAQLFLHRFFKMMALLCWHLFAMWGQDIYEMKLLAKQWCQTNTMVVRFLRILFKNLCSIKSCMHTLVTTHVASMCC